MRQKIVETVRARQASSAREGLRGRLRRTLVPIVSLCLLLASTPAGAKQLDAQDEPSATGPLTLENSQCSRDRRRFDGAVVARARICLYLYSFDEASETDVEDDYLVVWAQATVRVEPGWCITKVATDVALPAGTPVHASAPPDGTIAKRSAATVTLDANAGGNAAEPGTVANELVYRPGELTTATRAIAPSEDGKQEAQDLIRHKWRGESSHPLAFAMGLEVSHTAGSAPDIGFGLRYPIRNESC